MHPTRNANVRLEAFAGKAGEAGPAKELSLRPLLLYR